MSESSTPTDLVNQADAQKSQAIDDELLRLQTQALKERMEAQLGLRHLAVWAITGLGATILIFLGTWVLLFATRVGALLSTLTLLYMLGQSLFLGIFAAALLVVARFLQQLAMIIDITLETLRESLAKARAVEEGRTSFRELSAGLIHGALLPIVQDLITLKLGLIRLPISFVVNKILRRVARRLTRALSLPSTSAAQEQPAHKQTSSTKLQYSLTQGETHLDRIQHRVERIARRTKLATLLPAGLLFLIITALSSIPWLLIFFTSL